ncbi:hypothetical protein RhiirB3_453104 [Rhizophagus irregularis]|nr:hypothetical protein RhiirB3_453104 [Rhizophagus irregularis]
MEGKQIAKFLEVGLELRFCDEERYKWKKSELMVINPKLPRDELYINIGRDNSKVQATDKEIRYLGCYFSSSNSRKRSIKRLQDIIERFLNPIRRKRITVGHIAYLINHVLIPRVVYVAQLMTLSENEWNHLFTPVIKLVKQICGLPRSYPTSALYHRYILGINNPWDQICANQITAFTYLINSNSLASRSIMIRCRAAQLRLAIHDNIFEHESGSLFLGHQEAKSNLSLHNIITARKLNIIIQQDYINRSTWIISGGNMPIREIFITHRCLNLLRKIGTSNSYPLIYASQLILPSGHTMSWACYRFIAGLSAKGRIAKWFQLLTRWIKEISAPEMSKHSLFNFLSNILQPVSEDKRKHPYVIIKDKNNEVSIGFVKKRTHIKKNGEKIECLNIEVCNIEIYLDNPQKAIIQKQEHPKMITINQHNALKNGEKIECLIIEVCNMEICLDNPQKAIIQKQECSKIITITQHNALILPIFIRLLTGATTHVDWYYIVKSLNRTKNISANIDIQQLEKTPTINLNGDNLGLWINRWIEQDTLKQELTDIRHQLKSLKNIEYYTDGSLANRIINNNDLSHITDNTTVDLGAAFYTNNELGEFSVYSCLSLWPSSTRAEIVAIFLALLTAPENSNVTIYTDSLGAINSINSAFNSTTRTWLKKTNNLIIIKIIMLIREAAINLKLVKIKGHSGITGNDIADKLAKKGQCGNNLFRNNVDFINNILSYFPVFIDNPIEVNIRRFILKILATGEATEWSLLKNNQELCYGNVNQIDWKVTWLIFHYCKGFHCISMRLNYLWTFIAKLFHKILPLGSILAIRKLRLYKEMKCIIKCNKKENWNYLFECQAYEVAWEKILEITTKESIIICLKQKQIRGQGEDFIRKVIQNILGVTAKSEKFQKFQQLALEVKVETFLTARLQKDFKISLTKAQTLMANILIRFI